mgnify:CR=1 FL=1
MLKVLFTAMILGHALPAVSQSNESGLIHYTVYDGLPSSEVHDVYQDISGLLWVATDRGLCSFDGYEFTIYGSAEGMNEQSVWRIIEDSLHRLWFIGLSGRLHYLDKGRFFEFQGNEVIKGLIPMDLRDFGYFMSTDTFYFANTGSKYLFKISVSDFQLEVDTVVAPKGLNIIDVQEGVFVNGLFRPYKNRIVSVSYNDQAIGEFEKLSTQPGGIFHICKVKNDNSDILISTGTQLLRLRPDGERQMLQLPVAHRVYNIEKHKSGDIHVCVDNTIQEYLNGHVDTLKNSFNRWKISGCYEDSEGGHWISTLDNGLFYRPGKLIERVEAQRITGVISDLNVSAEGLLVKCDNDPRRLFILNEDNKIHRWFQYHYSASLVPKSVVKQFNDAEYFGFAATYNSPVVLGSIGDEFLVQKNWRQPSDSVVWIVNSVDVVKLTRDGWREIEALSRIRVYSIEYFKDRWFLGTTNGIYSVRNTKPVYLGKALKAFSHRVASLKAKDSLLYIATIGQGIQVYNGKRVRQYSTDNSSLSSNYCSEIFFDSQNNVWISSNNGLNRVSKTELDRGDPKFVVFKIQDGLSSNEVLTVEEKDNHLFIGTKAGLHQLNIAESDVEDKGKYNLQFEFFEAHGEEIPISKDIQLKPNQNSIRIGYKGYSYRSVGQLEYHYRIQELDSRWISTHQTSFDLFDLSSGSYTLELRCRGYKMSESGVVIQRFTILPPFYERSWFVASLVLLILGGVFLVFQLIRRRRKLARELQTYQYSTFTAQLNPHFIFNTLNAIQNLFLQRKIEDGVTYTSSFGQLLRGILKNPVKDFITLKEEIDQLSHYVRLEQLRMRADLRYVVEKEIVDTEDKIMIPPMLLQPLIENSITHGIVPKKGGTVTVRIVQSGKMLCILVQDDGIGFEAASKNKKGGSGSYGLSLVKKRVELINKMGKVNGQFSIVDLKSRGQEGTLIEFCIPLILESSSHD